MTPISEILTPRPGAGNGSPHNDLLSQSSSDSTESERTFPVPSRRTPRSEVRFASSGKAQGSVEYIMVDEIDEPPKDDTPVFDPRPQGLPARHASTGTTRRAPLRSARRRSLLHGLPISRMTISDDARDAGMTPEELAREICPESFTRYRRITSKEENRGACPLKVKSAMANIYPELSKEEQAAKFEREAKAMRRILETDYSPTTSSAGEEVDPERPTSDDFELLTVSAARDELEVVKKGWKSCSGLEELTNS